jgi:hypothetical protein
MSLYHTSFFPISLFTLPRMTSARHQARKKWVDYFLVVDPVLRHFDVIMMPAKTCQCLSCVERARGMCQARCDECGEVASKLQHATQGPRPIDEQPLIEYHCISITILASPAVAVSGKRPLCCDHRFVWARLWSILCSGTPAWCRTVRRRGRRDVLDG